MKGKRQLAKVKRSCRYENSSIYLIKLDQRRIDLGMIAIPRVSGFSQCSA